MEEKPYTYNHPIIMRYGDLDPQGHVNNAVYLTYLESARLGYYTQSGIWQPSAGTLTGMVVARTEIDFLAPIFFGQQVQVGLRLARLGRKSLTLDFQIEAVISRRPFARGLIVLVAYDTQSDQSILISQDWREKINHFEGRDQHEELT